MATTITVRNLSEATQRSLKHRAVDHGRSLEAEIRQILDDAVSAERSPSPAALIMAAAQEFRASLQSEGLESGLPPRLPDEQREVPW